MKRRLPLPFWIVLNRKITCLKCAHADLFKFWSIEFLSIRCPKCGWSLECEHAVKWNRWNEPDQWDIRLDIIEEMRWKKFGKIFRVTKGLIKLQRMEELKAWIEFVLRADISL